MTALREKIIEDMQLRGFAERTQEAYLLAVRQLATHYHKSPDRIDEEELRQYFLFLKNEKQAARATCTIALCGIKFFFVKLENDCVTFQYRATDTGVEKRCTLRAEEFIHRFLHHVLPKGFVKVRYYGLFAASRRARLLSLQQHLGQLPAPLPSGQTQPETSQTPPSPKLLCPQCGQPLRFQQTLPPTLCRSP